MRLVEKVFLDRIHAALFVFKNCSSQKGLHKLLNMLMRCAMGVGLSSWYQLGLFPEPPDIPEDAESPSESEEGPNLHVPRILFENTSQLLLEEEQQDGDGGPTSSPISPPTSPMTISTASPQDDDQAALLLEQIDGGEDNIASESELVTLTEIPKDDFDRFQCAAGMRLCECEGRYFLCTKGFCVQSLAGKKTRFFAIPSRSDLIDRTARAKESKKADINASATTRRAEDMTKLTAVLTRRRFRSKADGESRRILAGLVIYLPKLASLALEQSRT
jgi:hypothetical protein